MTSLGHPFIVLYLSAVSRQLCGKLWSSGKLCTALRLELDFLKSMRVTPWTWLATYPWDNRGPNGLLAWDSWWYQLLFLCCYLASSAKDSERNKQPICISLGLQQYFWMAVPSLSMDKSNSIDITLWFSFPSRRWNFLFWDTTILCHRNERWHKLNQNTGGNQAWKLPPGSKCWRPLVGPPTAEIVSN